MMGSAKGRDGIGRGNCFAIAGLAATLPFTDRNVLPAAAVTAAPARHERIQPPRPPRVVGLLARRSPTRRVNGPRRYKGPAWRDLPASVTFTTRLASNAVLYAPAPPAGGGLWK